MAQKRSAPSLGGQADISPEQNQRRRVDRTLCIKATEADIDQITSTFGLQQSKQFRLTEMKYDVPKHLVHSLAEIEAEQFITEAGCRWVIETVIRAAKGQFNDLVIEASSAKEASPAKEASSTKGIADSQTEISLTARPRSSEAPSTNPLPTSSSSAQTEAEAPSSNLRIWHEVDLTAEIYDRVSARTLVVKGRADWAVGYGNRFDATKEGSVLLAFEAKASGTLGAARPQLLTYLACVRQLRIQAGKGNRTVYGMYSDGNFWGFMCLKEDGQWLETNLIFRGWPHTLKKIYNFLVTILWAGARSSPSTSPIKPAEVQRREIEHYHSEVWVKLFVGVPNEPDTATEVGLESDAEVEETMS